MFNRIQPGMTEATRLTQRGKLTEAMALIQRMLRVKSRGGQRADAVPKVIDAEYSVIGPDGIYPNQAPAEDQPPRKKAGHAFRSHTLLRDAVDHGAAWKKFLEKGLAYEPPFEPLPEGAAFITSSWANDEASRDYKLYIPGSRSRERRPLIVMLHGCGQSAGDFAAGTQMNRIAEEEGFFVAYPAQDSSANQMRCWNWFKPEDQSRGHGEPSLIAGITRDVMEHYAIDPDRVYIAGLSAGGAAAAIIANAYPDLYAAVGVHSGLPAGAARDLSSALDAMRIGAKTAATYGAAVPAIIFHGGEDPIVHPSNSEAIAAQVLARSTGLSRTEEHGQAPGGHAYLRTIYADRKGDIQCEHWTIPKAGHAWAGGDPSGSHTDPKGPSASKEMVRFFLKHRRRG